MAFIFAIFLISTNVANAEKIKTCLGGSFVEHHPQTGDLCFCDAEGSLVAKQECIEGGVGCTVIDCEN